MVPPVAAPDEIVELHDALVATPLDDVETLRRLAWRARAIAAKRPRDFPVVLTAAQALAQSGLREEAATYARRAFDLRFSTSLGREEIITVCSMLALTKEATIAIREICEMPAYATSDVVVGNAGLAALLAGDIDLLRSVRRFASDRLAAEPEAVLKVIDRANLEPYLRSHMKIVNRYVKDSCCDVEIHESHIGDDKDAIHIDYRLDLPFAECLKRFDALGEELRAYYISAGRDDLPYLNVISHSLSPMPAYWIDAT